MKNKSIITGLLLGLLISVIVSFSLRLFVNYKQPEVINTILYDTIYPEIPEPKIIYTDEYKESYFKLKSEYKAVTSRLRDSLSRREVSIKYDTITKEVIVYVPINTYYFSDDSTYKATIKGYDVSLENIEIFNKTIHKTEIIKKSPRWGLGIQVGYGIANNLPSRYIGVGLQYNFITF